LTKQEIVRLLWDVLPDQLEDKQKVNKIGYLLKRLRLKGVIENESKGKESVWMLGKS
jgi:ATP-dependent DNA helicase RecG